MSDPVVEMYAKGYSMREVASQHRISLEGVRQILRKVRPDLIRKPWHGMGMSPSQRLAQHYGKV